MNLKQLRYFCEVVDAGSAVHAAERLFVAPTAISMQLAQLEEHLGGPLFDRTRRPIELTSLGIFFYPRAKELLSQAVRLDDEARGIAAGRRGWLGVGFIRSTTFSILPNAVRKFRETYPEVQLDLVETLSEYQPTMLRQGRIDIGLSRFIGGFDRPDGLTHTLIVDEPLVAALPSNHEFAHRSSLSAAEFCEIPYIIYPKDPHSPFGQRLLAALRSAGGEPVVAYEAIEIYTALTLVAAGLGGTLVGRSISENNRPDIAFVPINDLAQRTSVVAVTRTGAPQGLTDSFLDILTAQN